MADEADRGGPGADRPHRSRRRPFHEGLVALLDGAVAAGTFNELGMAVLRDQAIGMLTTRLSVEDWYRRHPEIDEQEILPPLFGLGLPRTGSTALSFLLAEDPPGPVAARLGGRRPDAAARPGDLRHRPPHRGHRGRASR